MKLKPSSSEELLVLSSQGVASPFTDAVADRRTGTEGKTDIAAIQGYGMNCVLHMIQTQYRKP